MHLTIKNGLCSNNINQIFQDTEGGIWIATYNGLAYIKDINDLEKIDIYNERHGLNDCHIRAVQQDRSGNIWVSTYTGISCWNIHQQKFYNYDSHEGVPLGGFVESSVATAPNGTIYFGSPNGVCYFNPQLLTYSQQISPIRLIACELIEEQIETHTPKILIPDEKTQFIFLIIKILFAYYSPLLTILKTDEWNMLTLWKEWKKYGII